MEILCKAYLDEWWPGHYWCFDYRALLNLPSCKSDSWRRNTFKCLCWYVEGEIGELVQPGRSKWGLSWGLFTQYCKNIYRIPLFSVLVLVYLLCICWDWQDQRCNLKCPKGYEINTELKYMCCNFCLGSSLWYKHLYPQFHKNTFTATENP